MIPVLIFGGAAAAVTIAGVLTGFGLAVAASAFTASQNGQFVQKVLKHQRQVESMKQKLGRLRLLKEHESKVVEVRALYRQAVLTGDEAWKFMNETRDNLNQLWAAMRYLDSRIPHSSSQERYRLIEISRELRRSHAAMRNKLLGLKEYVRPLNQRTHELKNQLGWPRMSQAPRIINMTMKGYNDGNKPNNRQYQ